MAVCAYTYANKSYIYFENRLHNEFGRHAELFVNLSVVLIDVFLYENTNLRNMSKYLIANRICI